MQACESIFGFLFGLTGADKLYSCNGIATVLILIASVVATIAWVRTVLLLWNAVKFDSATDNKRMSALTEMLLFWTVAPPVWFSIEYFYLFKHFGAGSGTSLEAFKYGQELVGKAWVSIVALLGGYIGVFGRVRGKADPGP